MTKKILLAVFALVALSGCSNPYDLLNSDVVRVEKNMDTLRMHLTSNRLANAIRLREYARLLSDADPNMNELAVSLAKEGTVEGQLFKSLEARLLDIKNHLPGENGRRDQIRDASNQVKLILNASQSDEFNRALADPVNVLADLSQGRLPRVDAVSAQYETGVAMEPGTQLVGNPHYGQWQTHSSGGSFWVWYGQYALLRNLLGGRDYVYSDWAHSRRYSYYHDYGRGNYTSPSQRRRQQAMQTRAERKFNRQGKTFNSPYARTRSGASRQVARIKSVRTSTTASSRSHNQFSARGAARGK